MHRTILFFTNGGRLAEINNRINGDAIEQRLSGTTALHSSDGRSLFAVKDSDGEQRKAFISNVLRGQLHFVHHTTVVAGQVIFDRADFSNQLRATGREVAFGPGFEGMHELDAPKGHPYRELAMILVGGAGLNIDEKFDRLWEWLEREDPIENLLADQLDYLHAVMATGKAPEKRGTALGKAITVADAQPAIDALVRKLGKPYETSQYATFTELRDLILGLKEPARTS